MVMGSTTSLSSPNRIPLAKVISSLRLSQRTQVSLIASSKSTYWWNQQLLQTTLLAHLPLKSRPASGVSDFWFPILTFLGMVSFPSCIHRQSLQEHSNRQHRYDSFYRELLVPYMKEFHLFLLHFLF